MKRKLHSVISFSIALIMLIALTAGAFITTNAEPEEEPFFQILNHKGESKIDTTVANGWYHYNHFKFNFDLPVDTSAADPYLHLYETFGPYINVNGVLVSESKQYKDDSSGGEPYFFTYDISKPTEITFYSNYGLWLPDSIKTSDTTAFTIQGTQKNIVKILKGFPLGGGQTLDYNITAVATGQDEWLITDDRTPVIPPVVVDPNKDPLEIKMGSFNSSLSGDTRTFPVLPAEMGGHYGNVKVVFSRPLVVATNDFDGIMAAVGEKILINNASLSSLNKVEDWNGLNGNNLRFELSANQMELTIGVRWDTISNIYLIAEYEKESVKHQYPQGEFHEWTKSVALTFKSGIKYGVGDVKELEKEIVWEFVTSETKEKDGYNYKTGEWKLGVPEGVITNGEDVIISMTDADGGPGITDAVSGVSWTSITKIVFSHSLEMDDVSEAALIERFGKYIDINGTSLADRYKSNNPQTGVAHGVNININAKKTELTLYSDVSLPGAISPSAIQLITLSKDMPLTNSVKLGREVMFEFLPEKGSWDLVSDVPDNGGDGDNNGGGDEVPDAGDKTYFAIALVAIISLAVLTISYKKSVK